MALGGIKERIMNRLPYIYVAIPLFVLLSCGDVLRSVAGSAMIVAVGALCVVAWGVVWLRLYKRQILRAEFSLLSILPYCIYYIAEQTGSRLFADSPTWSNLYALSWLGFIVVGIASVRPDAVGVPALKDPVFLLMTPLIILYAVSNFLQTYPTLSTP